MAYKAKILELAAGGTNAALVADNGGVLYSTATAVAILASTSTGNQVLLSGASGAPGWSTATYPGATTINQVLYSSANNVIAGITAANNGTMISGTTGVPSWLANGTTGQVLTATTGSPPSWTANGSGDVVGPASATDNALVKFDGTTGKLIKNGVITEDNTGNLSISAAVSGASLSAVVANTSNTASATAFYNAQVAGSTASDAYYKAEISGGQAWTLGLDNSDSDAFVISATATPGTTNIMHVATTGEINFPLQPAFFASAAGGNDLTGDSTLAVIGASTAWNEIYDQNSDFNTNGTFTAPVTGRYHFDGCVTAGGIIVSHTIAFVLLVASNRNVVGSLLAPFTILSASGESFLVSSDVDMDAADICTLSFEVDGSTKVVDVVTTGNTHFSGHLVC